ncbi:nickel uptake substrate-specific transmembrane region family protein [Asticcacaulis biprosthecium C19]|uniref:Nickel uptake substrate-specific transmembrane region family protein n=1 Tax=Asticcacaulis biprosthecium C19 TaxID=715226 RepID=F4QN58_9CAUL|nr:DUF4198 domain-containing protein [Asticcacaulis biprosthecium]EGF91649.1 nickel uptake substrate-specific transmembrane region family protein [Asticcacaulis biprosthecium C19]
MKKLYLSLLVLPFMASAALAHSPYLKPNTFNPDTKRPHVTVEASFAEGDLRPDVAMMSDHFVVVGPDGTVTPLTPAGRLKDASFLEVPLGGAGTYRVTSGLRTGRVAKAAVNNGQLHFQEGPQAKSEPGAVIVDVQSLTRADVYISKGKPGLLPPAGTGVELQPLTAPNDAYAGEAVRFAVLADGKPLSGERVTIVTDGQTYATNKTAEFDLVSDARGEVSFTPANAGLYLIQVRVRRPASDTTWTSSTATVTLEVLPQ